MSSEPENSQSGPSESAARREARRPGRPRPEEGSWPLSGWVAILVVGLVLGIFGSLVGAGTLYLRGQMRDHLLRRDGEILSGVALARQYANGHSAGLAARLGDPAEQLALALDISQLKEDVLAVRLFDAEGRFATAFPPNVTAEDLAASELAALRRLQPAGRFRDRAPLADYFWMESNDVSPAPLLEILIPLHLRGSDDLVAAAQLICDGQPLALQYARLDQHLWRLGLGVFAGGGVLLAVILLWAYRRLHRDHALLTDRTARLLRANHELALAAKTSALGSVAAHLIHGLGNPLAHLHDFIAAQGGNGDSSPDLGTVAEATRRMEQLVHEVVRVLGEERTGDRYELTLAEAAEVLQQKLEGTAVAAGVTLRLDVEAAGTLSNHQANLLLLILENLVHNALAVTPRGGQVQVAFGLEGEGLRCRVTDQGTGVAESVRPRLFTPCRSTHGGSGLGLALSRQLARHLGGELALASSTPAGCVFTLLLPFPAWSPSPRGGTPAGSVPAI